MWAASATQVTADWTGAWTTPEEAPRPKSKPAQTLHPTTRSNVQSATPAGAVGPTPLACADCGFRLAAKSPTAVGGYESRPPAGLLDIRWAEGWEWRHPSAPLDAQRGRKSIDSVDTALDSAHSSLVQGPNDGRIVSSFDPPIHRHTYKQASSYHTQRCEAAAGAAAGASEGAVAVAVAAARVSEDGGGEVEVEDVGMGSSMGSAWSGSRGASAGRAGASRRPRVRVIHLHKCCWGWTAPPPPP